MSSIVVGWLGFDSTATSGVLAKSFIAATKQTSALSGSFRKAVTKIVIFDPVFQIDLHLRDSTLHELTQSAAPNVEIVFADSALSLVEISDIVVIAVKSQCASEIIPPLRGHFGVKSPCRSVDRPTIVLSIMPEWSIRQLEELVVGDNVQPLSLIAVVRCMVIAGSQYSTFSFAVDRVNLARACGDDLRSSTEKNIDSVVRGILGCSGIVDAMPEALMHYAAAVQGSVDGKQMVIDTLAQGAVISRLPRPLANQLATEVVQSTVVLKDKVVSVGGSAIGGVASLGRSVLSAASSTVGGATAKPKAVGKRSENDGEKQQKKDDEVGKVSKL